MNTNKGSDVKQSGNDVESCQSQKILFQPNKRAFLQYNVMILVSFCRILNGLPDEINLFWRCSSPLMCYFMHFDTISSRIYGCFSALLAQNSKTEQAITLKLGNFSKLGISKILNFMN